MTALAAERVRELGPLRAAHSPNFPALLGELGASLLVTTYQAGRLVMVRDEGDHLNTHFRAFKAPMGLALADGGARLAIGTTLQVWEFRDVPDVARRLEPAGTHDACFLPRASHVTGNVLIHEMAYGGDVGRFSQKTVRSNQALGIRISHLFRISIVEIRFLGRIGLRNPTFDFPNGLEVCHAEAFLDSPVVHPPPHCHHPQGAPAPPPGRGGVGGPLRSVHVHRQQHT